MKKTGKTFIAAVFSTMLSFGSGLVPAPFIGTALAAEAQMEQSEASVDWTKGANSDVVAVGVGLPPEGRVGGTTLARRAAIVDAQRLLAEMIDGVQIDSETTMQDLMIQSDTVKTSVHATIKGAQIVDEGANADGSYYVKLRVPLYGVSSSLASAVLPAIKPSAAPQAAPEVVQPSISQEEIQAVRSVNYTGIVVDASGLGLTPTFSPILYDVNGRAVYGISNIESEIAISRGMVGYADTLDGATVGSRAGANPLVVKAVEVRGGKNSANPVNAVVSVEDADRILLANQDASFFSQGAVVFVK